MSAPDRRHAMCAKHGCQKTGTLMRRPSRRSWRGRPLRRLRSYKMPWMTASRSMHLKRFWDQRKRRVVNRMRRLVTSQSQSPTSQQKRSVPSGCNRKWSDHQSPITCPGWRRGRIVITTVPGMKIGAESHSNSRNRGSPRHWLERRHSPCRYSSDHPASTSGGTSDRSREWSSASSMATSTGSRHRDPTGQQESSRWSCDEDRGCGSTASSLSNRKTSSRDDLSGHPGLTQQACDQGGRCGSTEFPASPSTPRHGASTTHHSKSSSNGRYVKHTGEES